MKNILIVFLCIQFLFAGEIKIKAVNPTKAQEIKLPISNGLRNVPAGYLVYFVYTEHPDSLVSIKWEIKKPAKSKTKIVKADDQMNYIQPDIMGEYILSVSGKMKNGKSFSDKTYINCAGFVGNGLVLKTENKAQCINCHEDEITKWSKTSHSGIFKKGVTGKFKTYRADCISCHATGYDSSLTTTKFAKNFDYKWKLPDSLNEKAYEKIKKEHPVLVNRSEVQCEACHGPGSRHIGETGKNQIEKSYASGTCHTCHDFVTKPSKVSQYNVSKHGNLTKINNLARFNNEKCAYCHISEAYITEKINKQKSTAPYKNASAMNCVTCHTPHPSEVSYASLRSKSVKELCNNCHKNIISDDENLFSFTSQGLIYDGEGCSDFGSDSDIPNPHNNFKNDCAGCHMKSPDNKDNLNKFGSHTFKMTETGNKENYNLAACKNCHGKMNLNEITKFEKTVENYLAEIEKLLPKNKDGEFKKPADKSLTKIQSQASRNYHLIKFDKSNGLHNPGYVKNILKLTLNKLKNPQI